MHITREFSFVLCKKYLVGFMYQIFVSYIINVRDSGHRPQLFLNFNENEKLMTFLIGSRQRFWLRRVLWLLYQSDGLI